MFEFEIQTPRQIRLRIGRWHFRTWRSAFMRLPMGYVSPEVVYQVVGVDDAGEQVVQYEAFFSEAEAREFIERLVVDGGDRDSLRLNHIFVYVRVEDQEWDR